RARGRPHREGRRLRRDPGHQPAGRGAPARAAGAPRRHLPRHRGVPGRGGEADARVRGGGRARRRPDRLSDRRQRRARWRPDDLPPALARSGWEDHQDAGMTLIAEIKTQLEDAMREGDAARRDTLRLILASLQGAEKELQRPLSEDEELQVLQRERKKRLEAAEAFRSAGRDEQADKEEDELDVLEEFMPEPMSEDELEEIVDDVIAEVGATSMRDIGRVMADVMPQVAGRADGSAVSQIVREKLA